MTNIEKALQMAVFAHAGVVDKSLEPYILHPLTLMMRLKDKGYSEDYLCVALLHDVVEDTEITHNDIQKAGFNIDICYGVVAMTHEVGVPYQDYIDEIAKNEIARVVKLEDLMHNTDISRPGIENLSEKEMERFRKRALKYMIAYNKLSDGGLK